MITQMVRRKSTMCTQNTVASCVSFAYRVLLCNPDYLTRLNFDAITTIVGMGQVFHFLEHAGIPVVSRDVRQNLNNKIPNKQRSVVSARETNGKNFFSSLSPMHLLSVVPSLNASVYHCRTTLSHAF